MFHISRIIIHTFKEIKFLLNSHFHSNDLKNHSNEYILPTLEQTHFDSTPKCNLRSRVRWFTEFCNSHDLSQFAALFIDLGTKVSTVTSCLGLYFISVFVKTSVEWISFLTPDRERNNSLNVNQHLDFHSYSIWIKVWLK